MGPSVGLFLQPIIFIKPSVPDNVEEKAAFAKKLAKYYGVSLKEYVKALNEEIVYVYHRLTSMYSECQLNNLFTL